MEPNKPQNAQETMDALPALPWPQNEWIYETHFGTLIARNQGGQVFWTWKSTTGTYGPVTIGQKEITPRGLVDFLFVLGSFNTSVKDACTELDVLLRAKYM